MRIIGIDCKRLMGIFLFTYTFVVSVGALSAANLHLFLVGDYDATELLPALKFDVVNIKKEARFISSYTGLKLAETVLTGPLARTANVLTKLKALSCNADDVILFYFTGHGFRTPSKGDDPWPNLFFTTEYKGIDFSEVYDILSNKKARFRLMMVDCCNNVISDQSVPIAKDMLKAARPSKTVQENYKKLFLQFNGTIAIAGCTAGQTSLALSKGSLYTLSFLDCLHNAVKMSTQAVDWQALLDDASLTAGNWAHEIDEEQDPIFLITP